jgi:hypothetical protein
VLFLKTRENSVSQISPHTSGRSSHELEIRPSPDYPPTSIAAGPQNMHSNQQLQMQQQQEQQQQQPEKRSFFAKLKGLIKTDAQKKETTKPTRFVFSAVELEGVNFFFFFFFFFLSFFLFV